MRQRRLLKVALHAFAFKLDAIEEQWRRVLLTTMNQATDATTVVMSSEGPV